MAQLGSLVREREASPRGSGIIWYPLARRISAGRRVRAETPGAPRWPAGADQPGEPRSLAAPELEAHVLDGWAAAPEAPRASQRVLRAGFVRDSRAVCRWCGPPFIR